MQLGGLKVGRKFTWKTLTEKEFYMFLCITVFTGLVHVQHRGDYWRKQWPYNFNFPHEKMSRDWFETILWSLHLNNPKEDELNANKKKKKKTLWIMIGSSKWNPCTQTLWQPARLIASLLKTFVLMREWLRQRLGSVWSSTWGTNLLSGATNCTCWLCCRLHVALCSAWWWLHFTCRQLLYQSCLVNFLNTHIYYLYLKSMLKNKTKQNKKKPAVNFALHCVNMYICLSSLFNFIAYFCYCSCYCNMFLCL